MRAVTGKPIKLLGTGEKMDALEDFPPQARGRPYSRHGRYRLAGRAGVGDDRRRTGAGHGRANGQGPVRHERPVPAARADVQDGRHGLDHENDAGHRQDGQADRAGRYRRQRVQAPAGDHLVHDEAGTQDAETAQCQPQEAGRQGLRLDRSGNQPADEDAPPDGGHDEVHDRQEGRQARHDGPDGLHDGARPRYGSGAGGAGNAATSARYGCRWWHARCAGMDPKQLEEMARRMGGPGGPMGGMPKLPGLGGGSPFGGKKK